MATWAGPVEMYSTTVAPLATMALAGGSVRVTFPAATASDASLAVVTFRPRLPRSLAAAVGSLPDSLGTWTWALPDDTTRLTAEPLAACDRAWGVWLMTVLAGTVSEGCMVTDAVSPAWLRMVWASVTSLPTTLGTCTGEGPALTSRV